MAFLKRLICCGSRAKVKYDDEPESRANTSQSCLPRRVIAPCAKAAPASPVEHSAPSTENDHPAVAGSIADGTPSPSPTPSSMHKHSKSYSSVSSVGRRLVEKLADEVVEDFMATDMMPRFTYSVEEDPQMSSGTQLESQEDEMPMETLTDSAIEDMDQQHQTDDSIYPQKEEGELIDSASDTQNGSFKEKRAFFEERTQETVVRQFATMTGIAAMKPTPEWDREDKDRTDLYMYKHWNRPRPLRTTDRGGDGPRSPQLYNQSLSRVTRGESWILDDMGEEFSPSMVLDDRQRDENGFSPGSESWQFSGGTCVVRRIFHASSFADDSSSDSSDESVISVEINSYPKETSEETQNNGRALDWFVSRDRPPPQMTILQ